MMEGFGSFLGEASSLSRHFDTLFLALFILCSLVTIIITFLIIFFSVKYRRDSKVNRFTVRKSTAIEFVWTLIPFGLFLAIFVWASYFYTELLFPPDDEMVDLDIAVVGKQWMWKLQHPNGKREINKLHVPLGKNVRLTMVSQDVIHSFFIPAFRIKHDILPGRYITIWFRPIKLGEYHLFCAEYCGTDHSRMRGKVVVMEPSDYAQWLQQK
ncbi:cytochrome c oxidase subunit II [Nitrosococcus oceani]|uniref:cytochrome c oxidase subunit II n=1 Tax=Nitrosococcus oceani TaxID=1229 RepID=UPI0004E86DB1|nr:cytochrome c oxidase subunit II [Nitrosococcus oceani]KFI22972.1 cytochrome C oxidase subunit II [Nitrosococcus oceani]